ncbi:MAG: RraA family protein [Kiloniellales bacterium]
MALQRHRVDFETLSPKTLASWREIPPAVAGDCMNRTQCMAGAIKPVRPGMRLVGQARTVESMVGDNSISHVAAALAQPGEVLVIAAGGYTDVAVWGGVATHAALARGLAGVVVDGAVRDVAELRELGLPVYARGVVPAGPHKGFGGIIDGPIACAGCPVKPGDVVLGDDDGVVVVPLERQAAILKAGQAKLKEEEHWLEAIAAGRSMTEVHGLPEPEVIGE